MAVNLESLFYDDFYGAKWKVNNGEVRTITWSPVGNSLKLPSGEYVSVTASLDNYLDEIRKAFQIWDDAIEGIKFLETNSGNSADVAIAATDIDGHGGNYGYWNYNFDGNKHITEGTIGFDNYDLNNGWLLTTAMHEVGNILGLGDLADSTQYKSVQEDPFPERFSGNELWNYDKYLINQVYPNTEHEPELIPELTPAPTPNPTSTSDSDSNIEVPTDKKWANSLWKFSGKDDIINVYIDSEGSHKRKSKKVSSSHQNFYESLFQEIEDATQLKIEFTDSDDADIIIHSTGKRMSTKKKRGYFDVNSGKIGIKRLNDAGRENLASDVLTCFGLDFFEKNDVQNSDDSLMSYYLSGNGYNGLTASDIAALQSLW